MLKRMEAKNLSADDFLRKHSAVGSSGLIHIKIIKKHVDIVLEPAMSVAVTKCHQSPARDGKLYCRLPKRAEHVDFVFE